MVYSNISKFPKHPEQQDNEHLLKVIFCDANAGEITECQAQEIIEDAELDFSTIHTSGISKMGREGLDELMGIFVSAKTQDAAEEALGKLTVSASMHGCKFNRRTFNQSQF